jgi:hypothetical protein
MKRGARGFLKAIAALLCCISGGAHSAERVLGITFPSKLNMPGKSFSSVLVVLSCSHVYSIRSIPNDWYVQTLLPAHSGDPRWKAFPFSSQGLEFSAGHGASRLNNLAELNGSIQIAVEDPKCFDVTVVVEDDMRDDGWPRTVLRLKDLVLR